MKNILRTISIALMVLLLLTALVCVGDNYNKADNKFNQYTVIKDDWKLSRNNSEKEISLPYALRVSNKDSFSISHTFKKGEVINSDYLYVTLYYCDADIYIDGKLYYSYTFEKSATKKSGGMAYLFYEMPYDLLGHTLTITYKPQMNLVTYRIAGPSIGRKMDVFVNLFAHNIWDYALIFIIIVLGICIVSGSILIKVYSHKSDEVMLNLGLFAVICGIYLGVRLECVRIYFQNPLCIYTLEFFSLMLIMLPTLLLLKSVLFGRSRTIINASLIVCIANIIFQYILYMVTSVELREMLILSQVVLVITISACLYVIFIRKEVVDIHRKELTYSAIPIGVCSILEIALHYISITIQTGVLIKLGIIIFVIMEVYFSMKRYRQYLLEEQKNTIFREIAYTDIETGISNRNAYEHECEKLNAQTGIHESLSAIVFDLNGLKKVNDTLGHASGDMLIKGMAGILKTVFTNAIGVYRTGGDEFIVILGDTDEKERQKLLDILEIERKSCKLKDGMELSYSYGLAVFDSSKHTDVTTMIKDADNEMYAHKKNFYLSRDNSSLEK